jgi:large subunit ribosomal protein L6e
MPKFAKAARKTVKGRNPEIIPGLVAKGRSAARRVNKSRRTFAGVKVGGAAKPANKASKSSAVQAVAAKGAAGKKTASKAVAKKGTATRFYPADDVARPLPSRKGSKKAPVVRASITPGTVLILLAGRFRGRRVVFLKSLPSGLLLVTGPFKINGVPLRRVNQAYVIATSTKVDIAAAKVPAHVDDAYFKAAAEKKAAKSEEGFLAQGAGKVSKRTDAKKADQVAVDTPLLASVKKVPFLAAYLSSKFSLKKGQAPHELKF